MITIKTDCLKYKDTGIYSQKIYYSNTENNFTLTST